MTGSRRWAVIAFAVVTIACLACAYWAAFSTFQSYDDEGAHLEAVKAFLRGGSLYTDVYAYHGPFNFELMALLYRFSADVASSDAARFAVVAVWTLTALATGLAVARLTSSWPLGIAAQVAWFFAASTLINEPGHPVLSITLLLCVAACLIPGLPGRPRGALIGIGLVAGALVMTKVNVGGLMIIGVAYAAALTLAPLAPLRRVAPFAAAAVPLVLGASQLDTDAWRDWLLLSALATLALGLADDAPSERDGERREWGALIAFAAAALAMVIATIVILLVTGSALHDVLHDSFIRPSKHADVFNIAPQITDGVLPWAVLALVAALLCRAGIRSGRITARASAIGRIVAGVAIWFGLSNVPGLFLKDDNQALVLPTLLAWVVVLPLTRGPRPPWVRFTHTLVGALAVFQTLHIYPVAGSQKGMAVLLFVVLGALCIRDGLSELEPADGPVRHVVGLSAAAVLIVALVIPLLFTGSRTYAHGTALPFPGATRIHLDKPTAENYEQLVTALQLSCDTFMGEPGYYSLYGWTGLRPPDNLVMNEWMPILHKDEQATVVRDLLAHKRPCAIVNQDGIAFWQQGRPVKDGPLVRAIDAMKPVAKFGSYELRVPPARAASVSNGLRAILPGALEASPQG